MVSILLKYCGPKSHQKGETQAVIVDLVATLGFFCANNETNQVSGIDPTSDILFPLFLPSQERQSWRKHFDLFRNKELGMRRSQVTTYNYDPLLDFEQRNAYAFEVNG